MASNSVTHSFFPPITSFHSALNQIDWSSSPLGNLDTWPLSLRANVTLMLEAKVPMSIVWGPHRVLLYNEPYTQFLGEKHPWAIGRRLEEVWPEIWPDIGPLVDRARAGEAFHMEDVPLAIERNGGIEQAWFTYFFSPVRDDSGALSGMCSTVIETTGRVLAERDVRELNKTLEERVAARTLELERSEAHLLSLFKQTAAGIAETDLSGRLIRVNEKYCQILGESHDQLIGKDLRDLVHPEDWDENLRLLDNMFKTGDPFEIENRYVRSDGTPVWVTKMVSPIIQQGKKSPSSILAAVVDITERKKAEEALRQADRRKDEFLAMLAHELRNPLAPIAAAADLLELGPLNEARVKQTSGIIARQVKHMTGLVDDLLDVSRVTRGSVKLEKTKLDAKWILSEAAEQARPMIEKRRHRLTVHTPPEATFVSGDVKRLVQVITNLLNNAAKYTPEGGDIVLSMEVDGDHIKIAVSDNGIGMAPELQARAFELFTQAERTSDRSQGGLGIGLALVKSLVELHGGSVSAYSSGIGKGSRFIVCLPRLTDEKDFSSSERNMGGTVSPAKALKVMVVDDNADAAQMLAMLLEALGQQVLIEHHPQRALERARIDMPDVCVLDIGLPDMDGNELARRLRAQPENAQAVLIAVTGYGQEQDRDAALRAGFDHHFAKPVDMAKLSDLLNKMSKD